MRISNRMLENKLLAYGTAFDLLVTSPESIVSDNFLLQSRKKVVFTKLSNQGHKVRVMLLIA